MDLDSRLAHLPEERLLDAAAPHVVVENPHADSLAGLRGERVAEAAARLVVAEDVVLQVDVVVCPGDLPEQRLHLRSAVGVGGDAAAVERHGVACAPEQLRQRTVLFRQVGTAGVFGLLQLQGDPFARAARDDALFREILSEEEVEDEPRDGRQQQYDDPRQGLQRIPVVGDDDQHDAENRDRVEREERVCQDLLHGGLRGFFRSAARPGAAPLPDAGGAAPFRTATSPSRGKSRCRAGVRRRARSCVCGAWANRRSSRA